MKKQLATTGQNETLTEIEAVEQALLYNNVAQLKPEQRVQYLIRLCESLHINHLTKPFDFITFKGGKTIVYATKDCTDQLRARDKVCIAIKSREEAAGCYIVTVSAKTPDGREDESCGAVSMLEEDFIYNHLDQKVVNPNAGQSVIGQRRADSIMKAETKAKRRVTLSIAGLGMPTEDDLPALAAGFIESERQIPPALDEAKRLEYRNKATLLYELAEQASDDAERLAYKTQAMNYERASFPPEPAEHKAMMIAARAETKASDTVDLSAMPPAKAVAPPQPEVPPVATEPPPVVGKPAAPAPAPKATAKASAPKSESDWKTEVCHLGTESGPLGKTYGSMMGPDVLIATAEGWRKYLQTQIDKIAKGGKLTVADKRLAEILKVAEVEINERKKPQAQPKPSDGDATDTAGNLDRTYNSDQAIAAAKPANATEVNADAEPSAAEKALFGLVPNGDWRAVVGPQTLPAPALRDILICQIDPALMGMIEERIIKPDLVGKLEGGGCDRTPEESVWLEAWAMAVKACCFGESEGKALASIRAKLKLMAFPPEGEAKLIEQCAANRLLKDVPIGVKKLEALHIDNLRRLIMMWESVELIAKTVKVGLV